MQSLSLFFNFSPKKDNSSYSSQVSIDIGTLPNWFMKGTLLFTLPNGFNDFELSIQYMRQSLRKHPLACKP